MAVIQVNLHKFFPGSKPKSHWWKGHVISFSADPDLAPQENLRPLNDKFSPNSLSLEIFVPQCFKTIILNVLKIGTASYIHDTY